MLIGREKEKRSLTQAVQEEDSMFVALYGRRRVGKTYLVRETFNNRFTFYHTGLANSTMKKQLAAWRLSLREYGLQKAILPHTWLDAFDALKEIIRQSDLSKTFGMVGHRHVRTLSLSFAAVPHLGLSRKSSKTKEASTTASTPRFIFSRSPSTNASSMLSTANLA